MKRITQEERAFAEKVAEVLEETHKATKFQLALIVQALGADVVKALLKETLQIEQNGGVMLPDGSRRRTPGGVFFDLVKKRYAGKVPREVMMHHLFIKLPSSKPQKRPMNRPPVKRKPVRQVERKAS